MNIYGIGTDIVNINRIKLAIKKNRNFFKKKIFTNFEIKNCEKRRNKVECYAKRFAAKEALFKAVGVGNKLQFKDIEIKNNPAGAPKFDIKGNSPQIPVSSTIQNLLPTLYTTSPTKRFVY